MRIPDKLSTSPRPATPPSPPQGQATRPPEQWVLRPTEDADGLDAAQGIAALARSLPVPPLVARLLWLRGLCTDSRARRFLRPRLADLSPPEDLPNLIEAAERLARAVRDGERICVCGDYDVDGMTGTALLVRFFQLAGADVTWSIPDRELDGYGLSVRTIEKLAADGVKVLVTVDNGISAVEPLRRAAELGLDTVITDHHLPGDELPPAFAIVNPHMTPHRKGASDEDATTLCGCALGFKLAWGVADKLRTLGRKREQAFREFLRDAVGLVAMATVCDVVPLHGENRILVASGLAALRASTHPGVRALLEVAEVGSMPLTTEDVGFKLGPRLNAAGRLSKPQLVVELLTSADPDRCRDLARELDEANRTRRQIEKGVLAQAEDAARRQIEAGTSHSLVVWGDGWHVGVIGIVAARLVDRFARPTAVIGFDSDGGGRGSCRTPSHVNVHAALQSAAPHLESFGGHAMAAGMDIRKGNIEAFHSAFEDAVATQVNGAEARHVIDIDAETHVDEWNLEAVASIRRMAPFGSHNPQPVFVLRGAEVAGTPRLMGQASAHLSFALKQEGGAIRVVGFRKAAFYDLAAAGKPLDLVVTPVVNEWRGIRSAEFRLLDMKAAHTEPGSSA